MGFALKLRLATCVSFAIAECEESGYVGMTGQER